MEDEDTESRVMDNWPALDDLEYRNSTIDDTITHFNNRNSYSDGDDQCHTNCPQDSIPKNSDLNAKIFKGFKKRILAQTQENQNTVKKSFSQKNYHHHPNYYHHHQHSKKTKEKAGKVNEYAQYLGLQPSLNLEHSSYNSHNNTESSLNSRTNKTTNSQKSIACFKCHSGNQNFLSKKQSCSCSTTMIPLQGIASTSDLPSNKFKIQRKVYLCSACGTYFENWNLYLHVKEIHQRHLCLFCLGLFDHAERLSHHLMKNHSIPDTSFTSVEEFYQIFKGSCYLICCSCEKVFTEKDNFYNHFCTSPQKVQVTKNVCSICRQVDGNHMTTCGLAPGSDSEVSPTPGSPDDKISTCKNKLSGKGATKKQMRINRITNVTETLVNHFQNKKVDIEIKKTSVKLMKESQNREIRRDDVLNKTEVPTNSTRDTVAETIMEVSRYVDESDSNEKEEKKIATEEKQNVSEESSSENLQKTYDSYTETIMEVSRVGISEKSQISKEDDEEQQNQEETNDNDTSKSVSLNDTINSISDENKEDEIKSSNPKNEDDVRLSPHSDINEEKCHESETQNNLEINSPSNSPVSNKSLSPHQSKPEEEEEEEDEEEEGEEEAEPELEAEEEEEDEEVDVGVPKTMDTVDYQSFNTVTKTDRSLVIKICTNKNSQFSIAPRNVENSLNPESEENNNRESSASEEKSSERGRDSPESFHLNECDSDSDSEKLAVVDNSAEDQDLIPKEDEGEQQQQQEEEEEKIDDNPPKEQVEEKQENDGIILASEELPFIELNVEDIPDNMNPQDLLRKCIDAASYYCVYCNHARQIAVNGKQLGLHLLSEHRFQPQHPAVILNCEQVISKIKKSLIDLETQCFNFDSYNSEKGTYNIPSPRTYECFHCRHYSLLHKDIYLHNRKMHQKSILICIMCKSSFYNYSELLCHLCPGVYSPNDNVKYRCCLCPLNNIPSAFRLMVHLRKKHHTCDVCLESTGNQQKLSNHVWKHKLHHLCYRCGIAYRNKPDITKHLFWKHGTESVLCKKCLQKKWPHVYHFCIPPTAFICEECNLNFTRAVALKVHKRLHSGDFPYACQECAEKFISKKLLTKHEETHKEQPVIEEAIPVNEGKEPKEANQVETEKEEITESEKKEEEVIKEPVKKVDVYDLPPLNLSSDSDSDLDDKVKETINLDLLEEPKNDQVIHETITQIDNIVHVELNEEEKKEEAQIMDGIWDNFKTYAASLGIQDTSIPVKSTDTDIEFLKSVILADHDYCTVYSKEEKDEHHKARSKTPEVVPEVKTGYEQEALNKKKIKTKKRKRTDSSSSSDSSSDSDSSSCSCGSNCSCSSSSGSSSSSSSSSDSSSASETTSPKKKKKEREKEKENQSLEQLPKETISATTQENGTIEEIIEPGEAPQTLRESDLETDESETDEDFYDQYPQQLNKQTKKIDEQVNNGVLLETNSAPSPLASPFVPSVPSLPSAPSYPSVPSYSSVPSYPSVPSFPSVPSYPSGPSFPSVPSFPSGPSLPSAPSLPPVPSQKKKVKTKKRKRVDKGKKVVESIKLNIPKSFYQNKPGSSPSVITVTSSNFSTPKNSPKLIDNENKRSSKRKRIPKRFYGDSSDEENEKQLPKWKKIEPTTPVVMKIAAQNQVTPRIVTPPFLERTTLTLKRTANNYKIEEPKIDIQPSGGSDSDEDGESSSSTESDNEEKEQQLELQQQQLQLQQQQLQLQQQQLQQQQQQQLHLQQQQQQQQHHQHPSNSERATNLYCYCQCPYDEVSEMIACDGSDCRIEWFHFECVGIMVPPKGKWYCPDCRKRLGILDNYDEIITANTQ